MAFVAVGLVCFWLIDRAFVWLSLPNEIGFWASTGKGALFVLSIAPVVYLLVRHELRSTGRAVAAATNAERQLRAERDRLETIMEAIPVAIHSLHQRADGTACFPYASRRIEEVFGLPPEQLAVDSAPIHERVHPDDVGRVTASLAESARALTAWRSEFRVQHRSRGEIWVEGHSAPVGQPDGSVVWHGCFFDVTDRKRTELALRESADRLRTLVESAVDGIFVHDERGVVVDANDWACKSLGYTRDELIGKSPAEFDPTATPEMGRKLAEILRRGEPVEFEGVHLRKDGSTFPVEIRSREIVFGGRRRWMAIARDITDRKRAGEARARLAAIVESSLDAIISKTPDGVIQTWNPGAERLFGYTAAEVIGRSITLVIPTERRAEEDMILARIHAGDRVDHLDTVRVTKDGQRIHVSLTVSPIRDANGRIVGASKIARDITDRIRGERALQESQRRWRDLAEAMPHLVWTCEPDGRCDYLSRQWVEYTGRPESEQLGSGWLDAVHPDDRDRLMSTWTDVVARGSALDAEFRIRRHDGSYRWFKSRATPATDPDGAVVKWYGSNTDIEDMRRAAEALRESEGRFRATADDAPVAIWETNADHVGTFASRGWQELTGQDPAEAIGAGWLLMTHPDDAAMTEVAFRTANDRREGVDFDYRLRRADGAYRWATDRGRPRFGPAGEYLGMVGVVFDIDARKRAEEALRESEERFRTLVEYLPDAIALNVDGRVAFCNPACVRLFGAAGPEGLIGKTLFDLHPPERHDAVRVRIEAQRAIDEPAPGVEDEVLRLDGERVPVYFQILPITDRGTRSLLVVLHDLTERKRMDAQLRHQALMIREAGELAHVGGWGFDPATGQGDWTPEAFRIHGLPPRPTISVAEGLNFFCREDRPRIDAAVAAAAAHGTPYDLELQLDAADGARKWIRTICRPIVESGAVVRVRGSIQDITDRKRTEEEIRALNAGLEQRVRDRTAELESVNRELESFSYSVSHDLRAPIRHITAFTNIVLEEYGPQLPAESRGHLEQVAAAAARMGRLVDDLLAFSRLGRQPVRRHQVDTRRLVDDCLREVLQFDEARRVETRVGDLPACNGDAALLRQAWANLLSNAVKYSGKRDLAVIEVGAAPAPEGTAYFVRDNGVGFDMRYAHKLFGVFQRLHKTEEFKGTGIGLALVQRIVHRHGGRVWAEAEPDRGATFWFTLGPPDSPGGSNPG